MNETSPSPSPWQTAEVPAGDAEAPDAPAGRKRLLPPAAERALAEAAERRAERERAALPPEIDGRGGPEPTRYGDWEKGGIISDF